MLRTIEEGFEERHATWLELFFDLVFVVAVAELGQQLRPCGGSTSTSSTSRS
jgi:low temperature requirement protein LtrA